MLRMLALGFALLAALGGPASASLPQVSTDGGEVVWQLLSYDDGGVQRALVLHGDHQDPWVRIWGTGVDLYPKDIVASGNDAVFVADYGIIPHDSFAPAPACIVRISGSGSIVWEREVNWSDHGIRLEAVDTDPSGNVYATGQAWKYDDTPQPGGWYAIRGFIFTLKLSSSGEMLWARRWSADYYDFETGLAISVDGETVSVLAEYSGPLSSERTAPLLLWYRASDGILLDSSIWTSAEQDIFPRGLDVNGSGLTCVACDMPEYLLDIEQTRDIVILWFAGPGSFLYGYGIVGGQRRFLTAWDVGCAGDEVFIGGGYADYPLLPDPEWLGHYISDPLLLHFSGIYPAGHVLLEDSSGKYEDSYISSVTASDAGNVWLAGKLREDDDPTLDTTPYYAGSWITGQPALAVDAWEEESCGSGSFVVQAALLRQLDIQEFLGWTENERLYIGEIQWDYVPHQPDALLSASVSSGTAPLTVTFDASASTINEGSIVQFSFDVWDGDSGIGTIGGKGPSPYYEHTFDSPGSYRVRVVVTSDDDSFSFAWVSVNVS